MRQLWEKTRRRRPAGSPLRVLVLWITPNLANQATLIRSAQAEGGTITSLEHWGEPQEAGSVSMSFTVAPTFSLLNDLFLRLCHITETYQAEIRGLGLGRSNAVR